jgi:hypothetical protein
MKLDEIKKDDVKAKSKILKDLLNKFICKKCGRAAANEDNLCKPVSL